MTDDNKTIYEDVEAFLKEKGAGDFHADYIHGYVTAVACAPETLDYNVWPGHFFKSEHGSGRVFDDEEWQEVEDAVLRGYDQVTDCLLENDYYPHIAIGKDSKLLTREDAEIWTEGFLYGTKLWNEEILKGDNELLSSLALIYYFNKRYSSVNLDGKIKEDIETFNKDMNDRNPAVLMSVAVNHIYNRAVHKMGNKYPDLNKAISEILKFDVKPEYIHGFISSLACAPMMIKPSVWMDKLWEGFEAPVYNSTDDAMFVYNSLFRMYYKIGDDAELLGIKVQLIESEDIMEAVQPWAEGFCKACLLWQDRADMKERFMIEYKIADYYAHKGLVEEDFFKGYEEVEERINERRPLKNLNTVIFELQTRYRNQKPLTVKNDVKTGRNDPCPCGSGKKYKKCCGK